MENLDSLINELNSIVLKAKKAPFSNDDVIVSKAELFGMVTRLRDAYPQIVRDANDIVKERETILAKATDYANQVMDDAESKAKQLVDNAEIVKKSEARAQAMEQEAQEHYRKIEYEGRSLAFTMLSRAEEVLNDSLKLINDRKVHLIED